MADDNFDDLLDLTQDDEFVLATEAPADVTGVSEDDIDAMFKDDDPEPTPAFAPAPEPVVKKTRAPRTVKAALADFTEVGAEATKAKAEIAALKVDPLDAQIAEMQAALAVPVPAFDEDPEEDPEVVAKKAMIKDLQDQLARRNSAVIENAPSKLVRAAGDTVLIHFEVDGFIALGETWYRGQELEFEVGGEAYQATQDRNGDSWLDLVDDRAGQYKRWGKVFFESGPFIPRPGEVFQDELAATDARRGRAVPITQR